MGWFIAACIVIALAVIAGVITALIKVTPAPEEVTYATRAQQEKHEESKSAKQFGRLLAFGGLALGLIFLIPASFYTQSNGQGVIITRWGGSIVKADATQGWGQKAPWDSVHKWDLFTRDISLSEPSPDFEAEFEAGEITASRIATAVKSGDESGAQTWYDLDATYNLVREDESPAVVEARLLKLFKSYRSQDRFTRQEIYPAILQSANTIPSQYTTTQFRGAGSVDAAQKIMKQVNTDLDDVGVMITVAAIKNVDFTKAVEASLSVVEEKQQQEESARADAAAQDVKNQQMIENATAQAKANKILTDNPTPEQKIALEQIKAYGRGTVFVVPQGSTPLVDTAK